jgi:enoyl-CoA hydratase
VGWDTLLVEYEGPAALITMNRPDRLNAMTNTMVAELPDALREAAARRDTRAVILTGAGRAFSSGADVGQRLAGKVADTDAGLYAYRYEPHTDFSAMLGVIEDLPIPVIAAINGLCVGGGLELALACDLRFAAASARLGLTEPRVGLMPGSGGIVRLVKLVGIDVAKELAFLGRFVEAPEALSLRLVTRVFPDAELLSATIAWTADLVATSPVAVKMAKLACNATWNVGIESALAFERMAHSIARSTEDHREGITAFKEKRPPAFRGR